MKIEEILQESIKLCEKHQVQEVILFGSRAKGTARERSDIDLAVSGGQDIEGLGEELAELPTLYSIDLIDLDTCENQLLREDIQEYGRKIYEKV